MAQIKLLSLKALSWPVSSLLIAVIVTLVTVIFFAPIAPSAGANPYSHVEKLKMLSSIHFLRVFVFKDYWLTIFPCLASFLIGAAVEGGKWHR